MRKRLLIASTYLLVSAPISVPNNRVGVHILETSEAKPAAALVNSNGGDWGYVTIVLRSNDLDREKWVKFFEDCRKLHLIPIVRLATYPDGGTWVKPDALDLVDFANFLADMPWPVKNRYVVLFNEVNRAQEWGGQINPSEYATILLDSRRIFKQRSDDFFLISAGLDMSLDALTFYRQISAVQPNWYDAVDGIAVHIYPNNHYGIRSYIYELSLLHALGYASKPVFITEAGWPFGQIWQDQNIVAVTPFLLFAGTGDFAKFSLLNTDLSPRPSYNEIYNLSKIAGSPLFGEATMTSSTAFTSGSTYTTPTDLWWRRLTSFWFRILGQQRLSVGNAVFIADIARSPSQRASGLSGRLNMESDHGMLFIFDLPDKHAFWMKDMKFGLDFVWIRGGKVVEITENVFPPQTIVPQEKIDQVLEINAGSVKKYDIKVGAIVGGDKN